MFAIDTSSIDPNAPSVEERSVLREGFATLAPGPELAALLANLDAAALSSYDQVLVLEAQHRQASHYQAASYRTMAAIADSIRVEAGVDDAEAWNLASAEIGAALHLTRRASETELGVAWDLTTRFPQVLRAFECADLDRRRALTILHGAGHLPDPDRTAVVDTVMSEAPELTAGQLRARLRKLCVTADPESARRRYDQAVAQRRVELRAEPDGTATLAGYDLPPAQAQAATNHINDLARHLKTLGDTRSLDQIRADVLCDLLSGNHLRYAKGRGTVDITVDLATLTGLTDQPGDLAGYGPIIAQISRDTADQQRNSKWRWFVTDPDTGELLAHGTTKRRPGAETTRTVQFRNPRCVFPGCRMPAVESDLDHTVPWSRGGSTDPHNLKPLCRHHHRLRHLGWDYRIDADGTILWTSPSGHTYTVRPERDERAPPDE